MPLRGIVQLHTTTAWTRRVLLASANPAFPLFTHDLYRVESCHRSTERLSRSEAIMQGATPKDILNFEEALVNVGGSQELLGELAEALKQE